MPHLSFCVITISSKIDNTKSHFNYCWKP